MCVDSRISINVEYQIYVKHMCHSWYFYMVYIVKVLCVTIIGVYSPGGRCHKVYTSAQSAG